MAMFNSYVSWNEGTIWEWFTDGYWLLKQSQTIPQITIKYHK